MNRLTFLIFIFLISKSIFGQSKVEVYNSNEKLYAKTDFSKIDSLELWDFKIDYNYLSNNTVNEPKAIAKISFWRTKTVVDKKSMEIYGKNWTPNIDFEIYTVEDSIYCEKISKTTRLVSSCGPPMQGGDLLKIQNFILVNRNVCINCMKYDNGVDFCRPIIKYLMSNLMLTKNLTLSEIENQIKSMLNKASR